MALTSRLPCRPMRPAGISRRPTAVAVRAFKDSVVNVNTTYYNLLGVSKNCSRDAVRAAYESLVHAQPQAQYSADTLFSRAILLKSALESLADLELRRSYDQKLAHGIEGLKVPQADLPGALVLLQEIGEYESVIRLAAQWLDLNRNTQEFHDVATCLALAYCDRAGATLDALSSGAPSTSNTYGSGLRSLGGRSRSRGPEPVPPQLSSACEDLEKALALCKKHQVAQELQEEIEEALEGYRPQYAAELVALPLRPDTVQRRTYGLQMMRQCLAAPKAQEYDRARAQLAKLEEMLRAARLGLTAAEQIELYPHVLRSPSLAGNSAAASAATYDAALAYVSEGFALRMPHLVAKAEKLLQKVEAHAAREPGAQQAPVCVDRACCAVLLGDMSAAAQLLGLQQGSPYPQDPEVVAFVKENCDRARKGYSTGLVALARSWLKEVALAGFREWKGRGGAKELDSAVATESLNPWFRDGRVVLYIRFYAVAKWVPFLMEAIHFLTHMGPVLAKLFGKDASAGAVGPVPAAKGAAASSSSAPAAAAHSRQHQAQSHAGTSRNASAAALSAAAASLAAAGGAGQSMSMRVPSPPVRDVSPMAYGGSSGSRPYGSTSLRVSSPTPRDGSPRIDTAAVAAAAASYGQNRASPSVRMPSPPTRAADLRGSPSPRLVDSGLLSSYEQHGSGSALRRPSASPGVRDPSPQVFPELLASGSSPPPRLQASSPPASTSSPALGPTARGFVIGGGLTAGYVGGADASYASPSGGAGASTYEAASASSLEYANPRPRSPSANQAGNAGQASSATTQEAAAGAGNESGGTINILVDADGRVRLPEEPIVPIQELVRQQETLTMKELKERIPKELLPSSRSDDALSAKALRSQLNEMEKQMWDSPPAEGGIKGVGAVGGLMAGFFGYLIKTLGVAALVLGVVAYQAPHLLNLPVFAGAQAEAAAAVAAAPVAAAVSQPSQKGKWGRH